MCMGARGECGHAMFQGSGFRSCQARTSTSHGHAVQAWQQLTWTLRCRRSGALEAARVCMGRSMRVGAKVGTTEVAPSREGARSTVAPWVPTAQHRSTCSRGAGLSSCCSSQAWLLRRGFLGICRIVPCPCLVHAGWGKAQSAAAAACSAGAAMGVDSPAPAPAAGVHGSAAAAAHT